ncbi:MAG: hypothetical protein J6Q27_04580 [Clostridia bacterium]|nr:hypothetical protein [Clostridia bacterium]
MQEIKTNTAPAAAWCRTMSGSELGFCDACNGLGAGIRVIHIDTCNIPSSYKRKA